MLRRRTRTLLLAGLLATTACAAGPSVPVAQVAPVAGMVSAAHNDTSTPFNLVSLPALIDHEYDGRHLRVGHLEASDVASRRFHVTYRSGRLRISGQLTVPRRPGRFPVVVLAHGYQDPRSYRAAATLRREHTYLASHGYAVLMPDYRNHGESDREGPTATSEPLGYPEDVVNAVLAVKRADHPSLDASRVALLGRSMGGGVALAAVAARPDLVEALVLYSPVSSSAADNYRRWVAGRGELDARVRATYGPPARNRTFWREAAVRNYLDRVDVPVQVHHGTADSVCPVVWSRSTVAALRDAGQTVEYHEYPGEGHRFESAWWTMATRVTGFLDRNV